MTKSRSSNDDQRQRRQRRPTTEEATTTSGNDDDQQRHEQPDGTAGGRSTDKRVCGEMERAATQQAADTELVWTRRQGPRRTCPTKLAKRHGGEAEY
jgi:hypothetical protein